VKIAIHAEFTAGNKKIESRGITRMYVNAPPLVLVKRNKKCARYVPMNINGNVPPLNIYSDGQTIDHAIDAVLRRGLPSLVKLSTVYKLISCSRHRASTLSSETAACLRPPDIWLFGSWKCYFIDENHSYEQILDSTARKARDQFVPFVPREPE